MARVDSTTDALPATIDRYRILERLPSDRPDELYRGFDPNIERPIVIRVFTLPELDAAGIDGVRQLFFAEMHRTGMLAHAGIATLYDAGVLPNGLFMASEHVEGTSLADLVAQGLGPLAERVSMLVQLADAIDYAHAQGVLHLDLRATDVIIGADATVKIGAFGVAGAQDLGSRFASTAPKTTPEVLDRANDVQALHELARLVVGDSAPSGPFTTAAEFKYALLLGLGLDEMQVRSAWDTTREAGTFLAADHGAGSPQSAVNGDLTALHDSNSPTQLTPSGVESLVKPT